MKFKSTTSPGGLFPRHGHSSIFLVFVSLLLTGLFPVPRMAALTVTAVTSDNGYPAHKVQWTDGAGLPRSAVLVDQTTTKAPYTGYLRQYAYQVNGKTRTCTGTQNYATGGNLEFSGDGFVQNHTAASDTYPDGGDFSSGNGGGVPGTTTITLQGTNHAIITYSMPNYQIVNQAGQSVKVPTTIQWFFADGRSHPIFAISQDARATSGNIGADSRSPYGDMAYDGDGTHAYVGGCSYGDTYKFVTLAANPEQVTAASGWKDTQANTIPYAMQWANPASVDAEMGHVATVPITINDQGEDPQNYPVVDGRGTSKPNGPMLTDESWAFQILNFNFPASGPTTTKRLTWGACYGRVGGWDDSSPDYTDPRYPDTVSTSLTQYNQHANDPLGETESGTRKNGLLMAYSVFIVLGTHTGGYTNGTVGQQVLQMQNVAQASLTATIGTVAFSGPAGVGGAANATITYSPAGFNPTYATWEIAAKTNAVNATLAATIIYPLDHPIFVINNYTASRLPASIGVGPGLTNAGVNYFATLDTNGQRLWITVNRLLTNSLNLVVSPFGGVIVTPAPVISSIPASGLVGSAIVITGQNFLGATAVAFNGTATSYTVNSATQITATVPDTASSGKISVTTPGGTALSATSFAVLAPPFISTFSPTNGVAGTTVVITGANFSGATNVAFNGVAAKQFTVNSATQITVTVPAGATTGTLSVTTPNGTAASTAGFTVPANGTFINGAFIKGANLPWLDGQYDHDIGTNSVNGYACAYNSTHMNQYLADLHSMGITVVRLWLNENKQGLLLDATGKVTGLQSLFLTNLDNILQLAAQNGVAMYLTLNGGDSDWVLNTNKQASYVKYAVTPLAARYKNNPHIFALDVMNEIDGVVDSDGATWAQARSYVTAAVSAIHAADPTRLATCSVGYVPAWPTLGNLKGLGLDFYDFHDYEDSPTFPVAASLGLDKPVFIGEFGQSSSDGTYTDAVQSNVALNFLNQAYSGGYAGAEIWAYQYPGCPYADLPMVNPNGTWRSVDDTIQGWTPPAAATPTNLAIYTDSLVNGFANYSWATNVNANNTSPVYSGSDSIRVTAAPYTALSLYHSDFSTATFASLSFWINGGATGASGLQVLGVTNVGTSQYSAATYNLPTLVANTWTQFNIPLSALGVANITNCEGFWFWPTLAGATTFYVDAIQLNLATPPSLSLDVGAFRSGSVVMQLTGLSGQSYWVQTSTNQTTWTTISTNVLVSATATITNALNPSLNQQFWRVVRPP